MAFVEKRVYGRQHRALRAEWDPIVQTGGVSCARCGKRIRPGSKWELGHTDDWTAYSGPEHRRCNRKAAGEKRMRLEKIRHRTEPASRSW
ncbi:hypothetical protein ACK8HX_02140 [Oryzobacter sp. R7]|uniref:hypothetical protein n=1 Tax=Oryzobacter faecalis TaxID=3388656 RepID=UPI00398D5195